jgi:uncharacterized protein YfaT (DUF1175 family)
MRGVPRWFAVLCAIGFLALVCAFTVPHKLRPTSLKSTSVAASEASAAIEPQIPLTDSFGDGTPDFLRLHTAEDRAAFRRWFVLLAESQHYNRNRLPNEIDDCAALLRFSYRESLRKHNSAWANSLELPRTPLPGEVRQYHYPYTALGAALFRVRDGSFAADDLRNGVFADFADAKTLRQYNTYFVARDLARAQPGDMLFFRQAGHAMPFHTMIFLGQSQVDPGPERYVIYHTGPEGKWRGEVRRLSVAELMNYPDARWRPVAANPAFLGVYRWNILREGE